ncbi:MAG TPA: bifunctional glycosyltransferase/class I SAM-dependent methyltransferase [Polyangia bacterium]|nr:bifunctional glycosyltransferase/class I SAM-dependent methyltransferase [Polyangia bacterium]
MAASAPPDKKRLLVFVIAYYAESTLRSVLERIPSRIFTDFETEIVVIDDASEDRTFAIGNEYRATHPEVRVTVLRNEHNQGYGGNQKVGYQFAIDEGFDFVAMLHGDGQYAPEELPRLMEPLAAGQADAVFGSRMMSRFGALKGGMPLYKFVGNKILTAAQNLLLRTKLSEFHSGYRIYSVETLARLPFRLNSNDFHFDTEIIIQLLNAGARIRELPIPTYYGDEISRVNGLKYAREVMAASVRNALHRSGILYQRRFDTEPTGNTHYDLKLGYLSSHTLALAAIPEGAAVLDVGAGPGGLASELVDRGCRVSVVDRHAPSVRDDRIRVFQQDLDDSLTFDVKGYDYLLLLDIIEHLKDPEGFLDQLRAKFDHDKRTLILTTPNVAFIAQRLMLLLGQFNYGKAGILDHTHMRLFTFRSIRRLLADAGFRIKTVRGVPAPFPKVLGLGTLGRSAVAINDLLIRVSRTLFAYQIYIEAEGSPAVEYVLRSTREKSAP